MRPGVISLGPRIEFGTGAEQDLAPNASWFSTNYDAVVLSADELARSVARMTAFGVIV